MTRNPRVQQNKESYASHSYIYERFRPPVAVVGTVNSRWGPGDLFFRVKRSNVSLSMVTLGDACYSQEGRTGVVQEGQVFIAHCSCGQRFETGSSGFLHKRSVILEGVTLDAITRSCGLEGVDVVTPQNPVGVRSAFRRLHRLLREKKTGFTVEASRVAYDILLECGRSVSPAYPHEFTLAIGYIRQHIGEQLRLTEIASRANLSVRHCIRLFNRYAGVPPVTFVINQRMAIAANILLNTTSTVKQAAAEVGYDDPFRFSLQFKQRYGVSPKYYRTGNRVQASTAAKSSILAKNESVDQLDIPRDDRGTVQNGGPYTGGQERSERNVVIAAQGAHEQKTDAGD